MLVDESHQRSQKHYKLRMPRREKTTLMGELFQRSQKDKTAGKAKEGKVDMGG